MTLLGIRTATRRILNITDVNSNLITTAELTEWTNMWLRDIAAWLEYPKIEATANSVEGQANYNLPTDFMLLEEAFINVNGTDETPLDEVSQRDLRTRFGPTWREDANGQPKAIYFVDNAVFGIHPPPNAANSGANFIRIFYIAIPTALVQPSDTPDLHETMHDTAPFFVAGMASLKLKKMKDHDRFKFTYLRKRKELKNPVMKLAKGLKGWRWSSV